MRKFRTEEMAAHVPFLFLGFQLWFEALDQEHPSFAALASSYPTGLFSGAAWAP